MIKLKNKISMLEWAQLGPGSALKARGCSCSFCSASLNKTEKMAMQVCLGLGGLRAAIIILLVKECQSGPCQAVLTELWDGNGLKYCVIYWKRLFFFFLVSSFFLSILISKSSFNVQKPYLYTSTTTVRPLTVPSHTSPLLPLLCHSLPMRGLFQLLGSHILKAKLNFLLGEYFCIYSSTPASGKKGNYVGHSFLWVETE